MLISKYFIQHSPSLNTRLEQILVIHNRCSTGVVSYSVHESLGFIKPCLCWTPCCVIDRYIAVTLWPLLLSTGTERPFIYAVVCVDYNWSGLGVDVGWVWVQFLWLWILFSIIKWVLTRVHFPSSYLSLYVQDKATIHFWHKKYSPHNIAYNRPLGKHSMSVITMLQLQKCRFLSLYISWHIYNV